MVEHAEIGTLEAMGLHNDRIVIGRPPDGQSYADDILWSFATNDRTLIQGLGDVMEVEDIPQAAMGSVALVTFAPGDERPVATRVYFPAPGPGAEEIRLTRERLRESTVRRAFSSWKPPVALKRVSTSGWAPEQPSTVTRGCSTRLTCGRVRRSRSTIRIRAHRQIRECRTDT